MITNRPEEHAAHFIDKIPHLLESSDHQYGEELRTEEVRVVNAEVVIGIEAVDLHEDSKYVDQLLLSHVGHNLLADFAYELDETVRLHGAVLEHVAVLLHNRVGLHLHPPRVEVLKRGRVP